MPVRHGQKLSYHMLLPRQLEDALVAEADKQGLTIGKYVSCVIEQHLATVSEQSKVHP